MSIECPYAVSQPEPRDPRQLITLAADNCLNAPDATKEIADTLEGDLRKHYAQTRHDLANRDYLVARGVRQAVSSSLSFVADTTFMARAATLLENTGTIGGFVRDSFPAYESKFQPTEQGVMHDYMQILYGRMAMATQVSFASIKNGDLAEYAPLYAAREEAYEKYWMAKFVWQQKTDMNRAMPNRNPVTNWYGGLSETVGFTLDTMMHNNIAYFESHQGATPQQLTTNALRNLVRLTDQATVNRSALAQMYVDGKATKVKKWLLQEEGQKLPSARMITYMPGEHEARWTHPSLRKGAWSKPQFCAANIALQVPELLDDRVVGRFNNAILECSGVDIGLSAEEPFMSATVILAAAALVARETIDTSILSR